MMPIIYLSEWSEGPDILGFHQVEIVTKPFVPFQMLTKLDQLKVF